MLRQRDWLPVSRPPVLTRRRCANSVTRCLVAIQSRLTDCGCAGPVRVRAFRADVSGRTGLRGRCSFGFWPHRILADHRYQRRIVSGVTIPATCINARRPSRLPRTASRRRWASVSRSGRGPRCSRRIRFSSRRESIRSSWWLFAQRATVSTRNCDASGIARGYSPEMASTKSAVDDSPGLGRLFAPTVVGRCDDA